MSTAKAACPDGGRCWHNCPIEARCWRVTHAGPLTGVYPNNQWPDELTQTRPTGNPPTQTTPTTAIHNDIADELVARFGGILRCETCGTQQLLTRERLGVALTQGWPKCADLNGAWDHGVMRWWTQTQIDAGLMPEIWLRGDVVLDDTGNMFAFHPRHGWWGLISNQNSAQADTPPCPPLRLLIRDHKPVT